ncbi:YktB family protein [Paenibacillus apiarius]|uniref:UPF0637 protein M5X09_00720 n=1 Tax=Paenibacillus apiarius TaxID=46240 RepID=A0ABT4DLH0_9BACL|nr:DUF1054 domain-containing protein [Paenibacillus apiarius]MCY9513638.1 DUF1054 domain-containing protein [Paenibacillus apiarius]MCY9518189.1 DUF1054 domain-containing protein [Paenibacillus apiarius]MCY9551410.1 DUF1054 domain-containing protein [Paenibacillus apiarius]MCY9558564.1 DUF1054 domain-containing protein [Paenibacillus apiarius]MCY9684122.1 DUF1054 domain-containing protein [Paenibacillus apiarius]
MSFAGFTPSDFATFTIDGLDARMEAIRDRIQPKFRAIGEQLVGDAAVLSGQEMFLHIAKHARRTVNPPKDSWLAIGPNKRGYKSLPHFQVGLFDDHVFVWLAFIYEVSNKQNIAQAMLNEMDRVRAIVPKDYAVSMDHMKKNAVRFGDLGADELEARLNRFRDIKAAEWLIGRHIAANDPILANGAAFMSLARETMETLMPLYKLAVEA